MYSIIPLIIIHNFTFRVKYARTFIRYPLPAHWSQLKVRNSKWQIANDKPEEDRKKDPEETGGVGAASAGGG